VVGNLGQLLGSSNVALVLQKALCEDEVDLLERTTSRFGIELWKKKG